MQDALVYQLADIAALAQKTIQSQSQIDPIISINRQMRKQGFTTDVLTIDHLATNCRILFIIQDQQPNTVSYQCTQIDSEPAAQYQQMPLTKMDIDFFVQLMLQAFWNFLQLYELLKKSLFFLQKIR